jgi:hypothetical protein
VSLRPRAHQPRNSSARAAARHVGAILLGRQHRGKETNHEKGDPSRARNKPPRQHRHIPKSPAAIEAGLLSELNRSRGSVHRAGWLVSSWEVR